MKEWEFGDHGSPRPPCEPSWWGGDTNSCDSCLTGRVFGEAEYLER